MTTLDLTTPSDIRLILRGAAENVILNTLRRWPHWRCVEVEHDPLDGTRYLSVTLVAAREQEATLRDILRRSFGLTFPPEGGDCALTEARPPASWRRAG